MPSWSPPSSAALELVLGVAAARRAGAASDRLLMVGALSGQRVPVFVTGLLFILVFALWLGWFPVQGMRYPRGTAAGWSAAIDRAHLLVLPVATLTLPHIAVIARLTRSGIVEELGQPYVTTARAKELHPRRVVLRHALRNALAPVITALGNEAGLLLAGAVITERIFGWPGLGRLTLDAALARDYPLLLGVVLIVVVMVSGLNLVVDLLYPRLDPPVQLR